MTHPTALDRSSVASTPATGAPSAEVEVGRLQREFTRFARIGCFEDPLYVAISDAAAARPHWAGLLAAAPRVQRTPTLWFAALHDRLLERRDCGETDEALAAYYRSLGGSRAPDAALVGHLEDFIAREREALVSRIASRSTQTNEIGRCAVLWPILCELARRSGHERIALLDVGCSAGLNLGVDAWPYRHVDDLTNEPLAEKPAAPGVDVPVIETRVLAGAGRPLAATGGPVPRIVAREGIDPIPVAVDDVLAVRWLRACLWPHDTVRRARFDAAVAVAQGMRWPVRAVEAAQTTRAVEDWLARVPGDVLPVVFNSWVLAYFDPPSLEAHVASLLRGVVDRGAAWISAEPPQRARRWWPELPAPAALPAGSSVPAEEVADATAWTVALRGPDGEVAWWLPARSHAHGRWMQWPVWS